MMSPSGIRARNLNGGVFSSWHVEQLVRKSSNARRISGVARFGEATPD